jgi:hypothetical protein
VKPGGPARDDLEDTRKEKARHGVGHRAGKASKGLVLI